MSFIDRRYNNKTRKCLTCSKTFRPFYGRPFANYCSSSCFNETRRTGKINFAFLETWTWQLAYFLGLMITDGCVHRTHHGKHLRISFISKDKELTEFIRDNIAPQQLIHMYILKQKQGGHIYHWATSSNKLGEKLSEFGVIPRKSLIAELPKVPKRFQWDLVRGILDGDGSIGKTGYVRFGSRSKQFMLQLADLFEKQGLEFLFRRRKMGFCFAKPKKVTFYVIQFSKDRFAAQLTKLLYSSNRFCLQRKKDRALIVN